MTTNPDVLVIGAGPSGLTAATELRLRTGASVVVLEREQTAGGIPRHSDHIGYGMRDLHTVTTGPRYAARLVDAALDAGVELRTGTMVTAWTPETGAECTSPAGHSRLRGRATLLATGARERPRSARMIPGGRPAGVLTTGELQNTVHLHHRGAGTKAVVVGGELVSWSAVMTLREAGCETVAMVTRHARPESYGVFNLGGRAMFRTPLATHARVTQVLGRHRVTGVELEDSRTGERRIVECDTVVFTGDWIPDHELARAGGLALDPGTRGPLVDALGRTSHVGVFAAGNAVHPVDTADVAALGGRHAAGPSPASSPTRTPPRGEAGCGSRSRHRCAGPRPAGFTRTCRPRVSGS
ncbi:NAD(P)/FAD-dependent oxidoreductase [Pseudactinotalea sp. HY158]|uniref:NAD(P)/FAD-dependent oxidoreductase n=1 Tax=Pseudactinotalea sp. HY158 TaxID=2654547 RepID=UPI001E4AB822|nr:FAD-dependent oxidoreductase [Pseudactinotalea sp. HY158]